MKYCCKRCGYITDKKVDMCPKCGAPWSEFAECSESSATKKASCCGCRCKKK